MSEVIELGPHDNMTPEEALLLTAREKPKKVLILYFDEDGQFGTRSSAMTRETALWLIELARLGVLT